MTVIRSRQSIALVVASALGSATLVLATAPAASAYTTVVSNTDTIVINDLAPADPYPSQVQVSGVAGSVTDVSVTLGGVNHSFLADVGIVLVSPDGDALLIMDGSGDGPISGQDLVISDAGDTQLPPSEVPASGTYRPTAYDANPLFPPLGTQIGNPGPAGGGTATFASTFAGDDPNGTWSLYVRDFQGQDDGFISPGWALTITSSDTTDTPTVSDSVPSTTPSSPSSITAPLVRGTAQFGSTVNLYEDAACAGPAIASGTAAEFAFPGLRIGVLANATTTIYAKATKATLADSSCSQTSVSYHSDSTPPMAPASLSVTPTSPGTPTTPVVRGSAESGSTVTLYSNATCTGTPILTGSAAAFASPGLTASVAVGSTTSFAATATDAAGNTSQCSTPVTYVQMDNPPPPPSPSPPSTATSPQTTLTKTPAAHVRILKKRKKVRFAFVSDVAGAGFECSIDGSAFASCPSVLTLRVKAGRHTFAARAVVNGLVDPTPATYRFTVRRTPHR